MGITLTYVPQAWKISPVAKIVEVPVEVPVEVIPIAVPPSAPLSVAPQISTPVFPAPADDVCESRSPIRMSSEDAQIIKFDNLQFYILVGLFALYILVVAMKSNTMYL
jgi:hypothetical protein